MSGLLRASPRAPAFRQTRQGRHPPSCGHAARAHQAPIWNAQVPGLRSKGAAAQWCGATQPAPRFGGRALFRPTHRQRAAEPVRAELIGVGRCSLRVAASNVERIVALPADSVACVRNPRGSRVGVRSRGHHHHSLSHAHEAIHAERDDWVWVASAMGVSCVRWPVFARGLRDQLAFSAEDCSLRKMLARANRRSNRCLIGAPIGNPI